MSQRSTTSPDAQARSATSPWVRAIRWTSLTAALAWGAYWVTLFRTCEYGGFAEFRDLETFSLVSRVLVLVVFVVPAALVLGFRRDPVRWMLTVALVCFMSLFTAEAWAGAEEALWRRRAPHVEGPESSVIHAMQVGRDPFHPGFETVSTARWWPFQHHCLWYHPESGQFGGHD